MIFDLFDITLGYPLISAFSLSHPKSKSKLGKPWENTEVVLKSKKASIKPNGHLKTIRKISQLPHLKSGSSTTHFKMGKI